MSSPSERRSPTLSPAPLPFLSDLPSITPATLRETRRTFYINGSYPELSKASHELNHLSLRITISRIRKSHKILGDSVYSQPHFEEYTEVAYQDFLFPMGVELEPVSKATIGEGNIHVKVRKRLSYAGLISGENVKICLVSLLKVSVHRVASLSADFFILQ